VKPDNPDFTRLTATLPSPVPMEFPRSRTRFAESIASRTILAMVLALVAVVSLLVGGAAFYIFGKADTTLKRRAETILHVISVSAAGPVWNLDRDSGAAMLAGLKNEPDAVWAEIRDDWGAAFATYGPVESAPGDMVLSTPVVMEREGALRDIGTLRIAFTAARAKAAAWREIAALVTAGMLATLLMAACLARLMRRFTVPIGELTAVMEALHRGEFDETVVPETGRADELGAMARSLNGTLAELRSLNRELLARNDRFDAALNTMAQGLCMLDTERRVIVCNQRFLDLFGLDERDAAPGRPWRELMLRIGEVRDFSVADLLRYMDSSDPGAARPEAASFLDVLPDGRSIAISHRGTASGGVVSTYEDVSERQRAEARIAHMARHDALTDLPNRSLFRERLDESLRYIGQGDEVLAVLCLDLDRFKAVNDTLGHPVGDALLMLVSDRIRQDLGELDTVARLGGDEFAILLLDIASPSEAANLAHRLVAALSAPFDIDGNQVNVGATIGVAIAPFDASTSDQLLKQAELALYRAKSEGRGTYRFFEPGMDALAQARRILELDLRHALANGEFELHYQPLVQASTARVSGFETLLRWRHPLRGTVSPAEFIPVAEEVGLIVPIGAWVIEQACREAASWGDPSLRIAVNVSPVQFRTGNLRDTVVCALENSGLSPSRLELEITETVLLQESDSALDTLHRLRELGVRVSMDDFGTGYSSLSYLRSFPFDKIKIDRSFVTELGRDPGCAAIVSAVASLGLKLGITTTAEGVETPEQLDLIRAAGCAEVQGYLFSRPMPAAEAARWLQRRDNQYERGGASAYAQRLSA